MLRADWHLQQRALADARGGDRCHLLQRLERLGRHDVDVKDPTGQLVSTTSWVWPGCNCGGLTESTNAMIRFPRSATPQQRAAVVGAMMLVEYAVIEFRSQKNNRNN